VPSGDGGKRVPSGHNAEGVSDPQSSTEASADHGQWAARRLRLRNTTPKALATRRWGVKRVQTTAVGCTTIERPGRSLPPQAGEGAVHSQAPFPQRISAATQHGVSIVVCYSLQFSPGTLSLPFGQPAPSEEGALCGGGHRRELCAAGRELWGESSPCFIFSSPSPTAQPPALAACARAAAPSATGAAPRARATAQRR